MSKSDFQDAPDESSNLNLVSSITGTNVMYVIY